MAVVSLAGFLPAIGSSISFCPAAAFFGFLGTWFRRLLLADAPAQRLHKVDDLASSGRSFGVIGLPSTLVDEIDQSGLVVVHEHVRLEAPP